MGRLTGVAAVTGYHRKHAIRLLSGAVRDAKVEGCSPGITKPVTARRWVYCHEIRDSLIQLWEVSDRICSKRLRPIVPVLLEALERHGQIAVDEALRPKFLAVSAVSIDRLLTEVRLVAGGGRRRPAGFGSAVRRSVPIRTFNDWGSPSPGWVEVDIVAHDSNSRWSYRKNIRAFLEQIDEQSARLAEKTRAMVELFGESSVSRRLEAMPGVGPSTALAVEAFAPRMKKIRSRRDFAAWLGLIPQRLSSADHCRHDARDLGEPEIPRILELAGANARPQALHAGGDLASEEDGPRHFGYSDATRK